MIKPHGVEALDTNSPEFRLRQISGILIKAKQDNALKHEVWERKMDKLLADVQLAITGQGLALNEIETQAHELLLSVE